MKLSFKELVSSDQYEKNASQYCQAMITVSVTTFLVSIFFLKLKKSFWGAAIFLLLFGFGWCVVGIALLSLASYLVFCFLIVALSNHTEFPTGKPIDTIGWLLRIASQMWMLFSYVANGVLTFLVFSFFSA